MEIVQKLISLPSIFFDILIEKTDDLFTLIEPFRARVQQLVKKIPKILIKKSSPLTGQ